MPRYRYVIRRSTGLYVQAAHTFVRGTWTRNPWGARWFRTKRDALNRLAAADIRKDECEIVGVAWVATDAELETVSKQTDVGILTIWGSWVTRPPVPWPNDEQLASVARMTNLVELEIRRASAVTDIGLLHFRELKALRKLRLAGTQATDEGIERLRELLRDCKITRL